MVLPQEVVNHTGQIGVEIEPEWNRLMRLQRTGARLLCVVGFTCMIQLKVTVMDVSKLK
ncbi:hypothetical protein [Methylocaldum marinum]|uniref:hypothetical protein n=1 Tax=Methylocaldum marinum TaxID=1432792 RepID=UPI00147293A5|nr:hypothetical protein [Methylocaldum marinum]